MSTRLKVAYDKEIVSKLMNKLSLIKPFIKTNIFDECFISSITDDSRDVKKNSLFVARQGQNFHGLDFAKQAIENGASCIISDKNFVTIIFCYLTHQTSFALISFTATSKNNSNFF